MSTGTIQSVGYDGSVSEGLMALDWGEALGTQYSFRAFGDLKVTTTGAFGISIAAGACYGRGVIDIVTGATTLTAAGLGSGTRWDTVVMRRVWSLGVDGMTFTVAGSFLAINSGTSAEVATRTYTTPGTVDDQVIALLRVTSAGVQQVVDARRWAQKSILVAGGVYTIAGALPIESPVPEIGTRIVDLAQLREYIYTNAGLIALDDPNWGAFPLSGASGDLVAYSEAPFVGQSRGHVKNRGTIKRSNGQPLISHTYAVDGTNDVKIGGLASGLRPSSYRRFILPEIGSPDETNSFARCRVQDDGTVWLYSDGRDINAVDISGIAFFADGN